MQILMVIILNKITFFLMILKLLKNINSKTSNSGFFISESLLRKNSFSSIKKLTGIIKALKLNSFNLYLMTKH